MLKRAFAAAALFMGTGCVSMTEYDRLKDRYEKQEGYVKKHKSEILEFENREKMLTFQMKEKEKENDTLRTRLAKSEKLRSSAEAQKPKPQIVVTEQPASVKPQQETAFAGFHVNQETGGIVLESDVLFASGSSTLKDGGKKTLDELVGKLNGPEFKKYSIRIDGHTDDAPVVKTKKENHDNWELGAKRAKAVLDHLLAKGISPERCFYASFASYRPLVHGKGKTEVVHKDDGKKHHGKHITKTQEVTDRGGRAQNRRVEIVLFEKKI